jgi:hypothetical protein
VRSATSAAGSAQSADRSANNAQRSIAKAARRSASGRALRVLCGTLLAALCASACGAGLFRQYEYEEEIYLSLDGTATVYVNSSLAALNALRGTSFDTRPGARVDTAAVRAYYTTADSQVTRVTQWRRNNRRFVQVRMDVPDITRLGAVAPFAWSVYRFGQDGNLFVYQQAVGKAAGGSGDGAGWKGGELVAFRLHLPSKIRYHNTRGVESRGNILAWEQPLAARLRGEPVAIEARIDTQSILYTTLWLFGVTFLAVAAAFVGVIWFVMRRGGQARVEPATTQGSTFNTPR